MSSTYSIAAVVIHVRMKSYTFRSRTTLTAKNGIYKAASNDTLMLVPTFFSNTFPCDSIRGFEKVTGELRQLDEYYD